MIQNDLNWINIAIRHKKPVKAFFENWNILKRDLNFKARDLDR
jgi:hypothetical protein